MSQEMFKTLQKLTLLTKQKIFVIVMAFSPDLLKLIIQNLNP